MINPGLEMYARREPTPETRVKVSVGVLILDAKGRLLLERRSDNALWGLPGGALEPGESLTQAALREVMEETGLSVKITALLGVYSEPGQGRIVTYPDNGDVRQIVDVALYAEIESGELRLSHESLELKFFGPRELPRDLAPPAEAILADHLAGRLANIR